MERAGVTIDGIILAAGASRRMGQPKPALAAADGASFLEHAARTLRAAGCRRVLAVVGEAEQTRRDAEMLELELVINPRAQSEQIDSLRLALRRVDETTDAVLVLPVDLPLIQPETAASVVASFHARPAPIVVPAHGGVAGHPILLGRAIFGEILHEAWEEGMRSLLLTHARDVSMVDVTDPGILIDIDTPADYVRHIEHQ